jgi:hypothetical protein
MFKPRRMRCAENIVSMVERNSYRVWLESQKDKNNQEELVACD